MSHYYYLFVNLACLSIPLIASFYPRYAFWKEWKYFFPANIIVAIIFLVWDFIFTKMGVWGFNPDYLMGFYLLNLPLEEILFFICIPYCCVFTFFSIRYLIPKNPLDGIQKYITLILSIILCLFGLIFFDRWYTAVTFVATSIYLFYLIASKTNLAYHYLCFILIYPFFLASNGILTGSFLKEPIVWYNNLENLGIRIGTIPIEDSFYGMLLIFLNIQLYLFFKKRRIKVF